MLSTSRRVNVVNLRNFSSKLSVWSIWEIIKVRSIDRIPEKENAKVSRQTDLFHRDFEPFKLYIQQYIFISSSFINIAIQRKPKQVISRVYSSHFLSGIRSIPTRP